MLVPTLKLNGSRRDVMMPSTESQIWSNVVLLELHNNFSVLQHCFQYIKHEIFFSLLWEEFSVWHASLLNIAHHTILFIHFINFKLSSMLTHSLEGSVPVYKWLRQKGPLTRKVFYKRHLQSSLNITFWKWFI